MASLAGALPSAAARAGRRRRGGSERDARRLGMHGVADAAARLGPGRVCASFAKRKPRSVRDGGVTEHFVRKGLSMTVTDLTGEHLDDTRPCGPASAATVALLVRSRIRQGDPGGMSPSRCVRLQGSLPPTPGTSPRRCFAAAHRLTVVVQATGHGALPVGPSLLVHTGELSGCQADAHHRTALVGAGSGGSRCSTRHTRAAAVAGSAPGVGVVGFLTGGGIGPLVRSIGSSPDHVRGFELVTGTGARSSGSHRISTLNSGACVVVANSRHRDRGGDRSAAHPEFYGGALYFGADDAAAVLRAWQAGSAGSKRKRPPRLRCNNFPLPGVPETAGRPVHAGGALCRFLGDPCIAEQVLASRGPSPHR